MTHGFIYIAVKFVLDNLRHLTMVEWFKAVGYSFTKDKGKQIQNGRIAVDIFIILKWLLIFLLWSFGISNCFWSILVWYLILTNIYSYFYYHIWNDEALNTENFSKDRVRRRFVNLILAIAFSNFSFGYLYNLPYSKEMEWSNKLITDTKSIWFSISNSLAANYDAVKPLTNFGYSIAMIQLIITFLFVTIIISKSIPQTTSNE